MSDLAEEINSIKQQRDILAGWLEERDAEITSLRSELEVARKALEEIGYYDDFLDADAAKKMLCIARDVIFKLNQSPALQKDIHA